MAQQVVVSVATIERYKDHWNRGIQQSRRVWSHVYGQPQKRCGNPLDLGFVAGRAAQQLTFEPSVLGAYFAAAGNAGSFSTSRASCWMITVALVFAPIFLRRSSDAIVCARS